MRFYWPIAKVDAAQHMVWGYASTEAVDDQGETVAREALEAALDDYMRFANIREMHRDSAVGVAKEAEIDGKGLYLGAKIVDDAAWRKVVEGVYKGFSIGGRVTRRDPADRSHITGLTLTEISVVDRPANPEAVFDCWKRSTVSPTGDSMANPEAARAALPDPGPPRSHTDYADPGYRPDGRKRYPIDTERHIRAAWAFIHQPGNARRYTSGQVAEIKARIVAAWRAVIDRDGPPEAAHGAPADAAAAQKGPAEAGRLAQLVLDLDWLYDQLEPQMALDEDDPSQLQRVLDSIAELRDFLDDFVAEDGSDPEDGDDEGAASDGVAALARGATLRKRRRADLAPLAAGLARLAGAIVPRLDALQKRVEEIARTPLPPQTAARAFAGVAKRDDGGGALAADEDVVAALARMSDDERTLTLIKAARANPLRLIR